MKPWETPAKNLKVYNPKERKCPKHLLVELEEAIRDNCPQEYINWLKERIARYAPEIVE